MSTPPLFDWRQHGDSLAALLAHRAEGLGDRPYIHLIAEDGTERALSFAAVHQSARRTAAGLRAAGVKPGDRVLNVLPTGTEFLDTFFGTLLAGAAAVPCYPPARLKGLTEYQTRLARLIAEARPALIVTLPKLRMVVEAAAFEAGSAVRVVLAGDLPAEPTGVWDDPGAEAIALVQFSSGSTGHPRGVMLTHRNLLANLASVLSVIRPTPEDINCSWLPLYHDMGLIGGLLMPLFCGNPLVLMSPQSFLLDPKRWLWAIHRHRATISTAPNFAYQLIASRLDDVELEGLDLSSWRLALNGAESVTQATLDAVAAKLAPYGFSPTALTPVYGLAEAALGAVFPILGRPVCLDYVDPARLAEAGAAEPADPSVGAAFASVGEPLPGFAMRIVGPDGAVVPERRVGEIQLQGPSLMQGYLGHPEATAAAFDADWLRTGDLGYQADGELFVVGRLKDLIVKGGKNYVPQDLERAAEEVPGIRRGCVAAFGVPSTDTGTEAVVVVAESREPAPRHDELARAIAARVGAACGLTPDHVTIVPPGSVPKTSSGKLQRSRCRELWRTGAIAPAAEPGLLDKSRLVGQAMAQRVIARAPRSWSASRDPHDPR